MRSSQRIIRDDSRCIRELHVLLHEPAQFERWQRSRGGAVGYDGAPLPYHLQVALEPVNDQLEYECRVQEYREICSRILPDGVEYRIHALSVGELKHAFDDILLLV